MVHPYSGMLFNKQKERTISSITCRIRKCILLSERDQTQKSIYRMLYLYDLWVRVEELTAEKCCKDFFGHGGHALSLYLDLDGDYKMACVSQNLPDI